MIWSSNLDKARAAWGHDVPNWVMLLATAADRLGQRAAGKAINRSGGYVSRVLSADYPGNLAEAEQIVTAAFGNAEVNCPEFGPIPHKSCLQNRRRTGTPTTFLNRCAKRDGDK